MDRSASSRSSHRHSGPWFPNTRLPTLAEINQLRSYQPQPLELPDAFIEPEAELNLSLAERRPRGAPTKPKNMLIKQHRFRNTKGKPFKFSFVPQMLISHLQHLAGTKVKTRPVVATWLRSYSAEGRGIQAMVNSLVGPDLGVLAFKRIVSLNELLTWLAGESYNEGYDSGELSRIRIEVFRLLCILKCVGIKEHYATDFSVETSSEAAAAIFRHYVTTILWEELELETITEEEIHQTLQEARHQGQRHLS